VLSATDQPATQSALLTPNWRGCEGNAHEYENFALTGIAANDADGKRRDIYVHAKIMLVDDSWATIGSCHLHAGSMYGHTEMNASFWDRAVVRGLRCALLDEHLGLDTTHLDLQSALHVYREMARGTG
jgi:cardiolipin synthase A/B